MVCLTRTVAVMTVLLLTAGMIFIYRVVRECKATVASWQGEPALDRPLVAWRQSTTWSFLQVDRSTDMIRTHYDLCNQSTISHVKMIQGQDTFQLSSITPTLNDSLFQSVS